MTECYQIDDSLDLGPGYVLKLSGNISSNQRSILSGRLYHNDKAIGGYITRSMYDPAMLDAKKLEIISVATSRMHDTIHAERMATRNIFGYDAIKFDLAFADVANDDSLFSSWAVSRKKILRRFETHFLPMLRARHDYAVIDADELNVMFEQTVYDATQSLNFKGRIEATRKKKQIEYLQYERIYAAMRKVDPELPIIKFDTLLTRTIYGDPEQFRSIPELYRQRLWREFERNVATQPVAVKDGILIASGGLRPGEASIIHPDDLIYEDNYCWLKVVEQEARGHATNILKRPDSYRIAIIPSWGATLLKRCAEHIAIPGNRDIPLMSKDDTRPTIIHMMSKCGFAEMLDAHSSVLDDRFGKIAKDVFSLAYRPHLLRADYASRMRNVCGMDSDTLDLLMGHPPATRHKRDLPDLSLRQTRKAIADIMERYVYNPDMSQNPSVSPLPISPKQDVPTFTTIHLINNSDEDMVVDLDLEANESGETITLRLPREANRIHNRSTPQIKQPRDLFSPQFNTKEKNLED